MIKRIKKKYIIIVMSSVIAVLGLIITAINIANYSSINSWLDEKVSMLVRNEGLMPEVPFGEPPEETEPNEEGENGETSNDGEENTETAPDGSGVEDPAEDDQEPGGEDLPENGSNTEDVEENKEDDYYHHMSPETPFELRYFSVKLNTSGEILLIDTSKIAAVDNSEAEKYAIDAFERDKEKGFVDSYKYMVGDTKDGNLIYVFLDVDRELNSLRAFMVSSLVITAIGIIMVLALVILLSGTALKPILESYEKQKRFITDAGHEMKTPLTVISANAEIIEMENGESQWISGIKSQVSKLASLTEKLVILSKMEEGAKLEMNEFSLSQAFYDTCDQYKSMALSKNVNFDLLIADNVRLVGNENEIRRCITLLLDNAFRYVNDGGFVKVSVQNLSSGAEIKIKNSTNGVEKGALDSWFDRFYRTDLSRNSDTGGSGIGLSVVKAIIIAHGGSVKAISTDGVDVEFTINI